MSHPLSKLLPSQDNMSKLLPAVPDMDTQLQLAAKMIDKKTATHKVSLRGIPIRSCNIFLFRDNTAMAPISWSTLSWRNIIFSSNKSCPAFTVYPQPTPLSSGLGFSSSDKVHIRRESSGEEKSAAGHQTDAVLRFQVEIPDNYPDGDVPKVVFEHHVFHPCIDPTTHQLNVKQVPALS